MGETGERVNYSDREEQGDSGEMIDFWIGHRWTQVTKIQTRERATKRV